MALVKFAKTLNPKVGFVFPGSREASLWGEIHVVKSVGPECVASDSPVLFCRCADIGWISEQAQFRSSVSNRNQHGLVGPDTEVSVLIDVHRRIDGERLSPLKRGAPAQAPPAERTLKRDSDKSAIIMSVNPETRSAAGSITIAVTRKYL